VGSEDWPAPKARFHDLWNLVSDPAMPVVAWSRVSRNRGSRTAGVDAGTRRRVEARGIDRFLCGLREKLRAGTLRPLPVRERLIPKRGDEKKFHSVLERVVRFLSREHGNPVIG
jgi:RNA-directed DNA polymerase